MPTKKKGRAIIWRRVFMNCILFSRYFLTNRAVNQFIPPMQIELLPVIFTLRLIATSLTVNIPIFTWDRPVVGMEELDESFPEVFHRLFI